MVLAMKAPVNMVGRLDLASLPGLRELNMKEILLIMNSMVRDGTNGLMVANITALG